MAYQFDDPLSNLYDQVTKAHADIKRVAKRLASPGPNVDKQKCLQWAERAAGQLQKAMLTLSMNPASLLGSIGGKKTAERGPDYFRKIAAMRKTKGGGRPRKNPSEGPNPGEVAR